VKAKEFMKEIEEKMISTQKINIYPFSSHPLKFYHALTQKLLSFFKLQTVLFLYGTFLLSKLLPFSCNLYFSHFIKI